MDIQLSENNVEQSPVASTIIFEGGNLTIINCSFNTISKVTIVGINLIMRNCNFFFGYKKISMDFPVSYDIIQASLTEDVIINDIIFQGNGYGIINKILADRDSIIDGITFDSIESDDFFLL